MHHIRPGFLTLAITASLLLWASLSVAPATAASVTYNFTGTVNPDNPFLGPTFSTSLPSNNTMIGSLTYNDSSSDDPPAVDFFPSSSNVGRYDNVITALTVTFNDGYMATLKSLNGFNSIVIANDFNGLITTGEINDQYNASALMTGADVNGRPLTSFVISADYKPSAFNSDALVPPTLANLVTGSSVRFQLIFGQGFSTAILAGDITSITPVPLPPAVILFGAGLVALIGLGARNWRQKGNNLT